MTLLMSGAHKRQCIGSQFSCTWIPQRSPSQECLGLIHVTQTDVMGFIDGPCTNRPCEALALH